jgi:hypothetical protein
MCVKALIYMRYWNWARVRALPWMGPYSSKASLDELSGIEPNDHYIM